MHKPRVMFPQHPLLTAFQATDQALQIELVSLFGKDAGNARYQARGRGTEGSILRGLHNAREAARLAWERAGRPSYAEA